LRWLGWLIWFRWIKLEAEKGSLFFLSPWKNSKPESRNPEQIKNPKF
jgi:hypothetical protein